VAEGATGGYHRLRPDDGETGTPCAVTPLAVAWRALMDDREAAEIAKALGHPLRLGFLRTLRATDMLSPSEYAEESAEPLANIAYHVKALRAAGLLEVAELVPRRGAMEHRYSLTGPRAEVGRTIMELLEKD
jgi:DNA-binding transcriptional ArsR family regulator